MGESINKEFSPGFIQDLADLLEMCKNNNTDNLAMEMDINGKTLIMDIQFRVKEEEWK